MRCFSISSSLAAILAGTTLAFASVFAAGAESPANAPQAAAAAPVVRDYHTSVGPIRLTFAGENVTGRYRIAVKTPADEGTIQGTLKDGLLDATWTEPHSSGRILIGFTQDFARCSILYNSAKNPTHWQGEWIGVDAARLDSVPASLRSRVRGDWQ